MPPVGPGSDRDSDPPWGMVEVRSGLQLAEAPGILDAIPIAKTVALVLLGFLIAPSLGIFFLHFGSKFLHCLLVAVATTATPEASLPEDYRCSEAGRRGLTPTVHHRRSHRRLTERFTLQLSKQDTLTSTAKSALSLR